MQQLQDRKLWFAAKQYGYGWYPVTWQGWGVLTLYILGVFAAAHGSTNIFMFCVELVILTVFLIIVCVIKGEKARWRWGGK
jgi:hypothetical protein